MWTYNSAIIAYLFLATLNLVFMTWQDLKKGMVDDRRNHMMYGVIIAYSLFLNRSLLYIVMVFLGGLAYYLLLYFFKYGKGDQNTVMWVVTGFGMLHWYFAVAFGVVMGLLTIVMILTVHLAKKKNIKYRGVTLSSVPYYPTLFASFLATAIPILFMLY